MSEDKNSRLFRFVQEARARLSSSNHEYINNQEAESLYMLPEEPPLTENVRDLPPPASPDPEDQQDSMDFQEWWQNRHPLPDDLQEMPQTPDSGILHIDDDPPEMQEESPSPPPRRRKKLDLTHKPIGWSYVEFYGVKDPSENSESEGILRVNMDLGQDSLEKAISISSFLQSPQENLTGKPLRRSRLEEFILAASLKKKSEENNQKSPEGKNGSQSPQKSLSTSSKIVESKRSDQQLSSGNKISSQFPQGFLSTSSNIVEFKKNDPKSSSEDKNRSQSPQKSQISNEIGILTFEELLQKALKKVESDEGGRKVTGNENNSQSPQISQISNAIGSLTFEELLQKALKKVEPDEGGRKVTENENNSQSLQEVRINNPTESLLTSSKIVVFEKDDQKIAERSKLEDPLLTSSEIVEFAKGDQKLSLHQSHSQSPQKSRTSDSSEKFKQEEFFSTWPKYMESENGQNSPPIGSQVSNSSGRSKLTELISMSSQEKKPEHGELISKDSQSPQENLTGTTAGSKLEELVLTPSKNEESPKEDQKLSLDKSLSESSQCAKFMFGEVLSTSPKTMDSTSDSLRKWELEELFSTPLESQKNDSELSLNGSRSQSPQDNKNGDSIKKPKLLTSSQEKKTDRGDKKSSRDKTCSHSPQERCNSDSSDKSKHREPLQISPKIVESAKSSGRTKIDEPRSTSSSGKKSGNGDQNSSRDKNSSQSSRGSQMSSSNRGSKREEPLKSSSHKKESEKNCNTSRQAPSRGESRLEKPLFWTLKQKASEMRKRNQKLPQDAKNTNKCSCGKSRPALQTNASENSDQQDSKQNSENRNRSSSPEEGEIKDSKKMLPRPAEEKGRDQKPTQEGKRSSPLRDQENRLCRKKPIKTQRHLYRKRATSPRRISLPKSYKVSSPPRRNREQKNRSSLPSSHMIKIDKGIFLRTRSPLRKKTSTSSATRHKDQNRKEEKSTNRTTVEAQPDQPISSLKERVMKMISQNDVPFMISTAVLRDQQFDEMLKS